MFVSCGMLVGIGCAGPPAPSQPAAVTPQMEVEHEEELSSGECNAGNFDHSLPREQLSAVIAAPEGFYGRKLTLRGVFFVGGVEMVFLLEPRQQKEGVRLDLHRIHTKTVDEVRGCPWQVVDVQGYVSHAPHRGKEVTFVMAEVMVGVEGKRERAVSPRNGSVPVPK